MATNRREQPVPVLSPPTRKRRTSRVGRTTRVNSVRELPTHRLMTAARGTRVNSAVRRGHFTPDVQGGSATLLSKRSANPRTEPNEGVPTNEPRDRSTIAAHSMNVSRLVFLCRVRNRLLAFRIAVQNGIDANYRLMTGESKGRIKIKREPTLEDIAVAQECMGAAPDVEPIERKLKATEKEIAKIATALPVWSFVESIRGCGAAGLGYIVGAAGDLSNYSNPGKLWKRMGLALVDGERQRRVADAEKALAHGYNPRRRSLMHVIGDSLLKGNKDGYYRQVYDARKAYTEANRPDWTKAHRHMDALRYMEKRLLRHLWQAWKRTAANIMYSDSALPSDVVEQAPDRLVAATMLPADLDAEAIGGQVTSRAVPQHPTVM